jgi:hypothetical protein
MIPKGSGLKETATSEFRRPGHGDVSGMEYSFVSNNHFKYREMSKACPLYRRNSWSAPLDRSVPHLVTSKIDEKTRHLYRGETQRGFIVCVFTLLFRDSFQVFWDLIWSSESRAWLVGALL